ncbi:hypothetical protein [Pseudomonas parafulva]|uniref:hypothetical protein n=1 Tax=Pseudomonas parafulva TaxID=157782 RepID=UPI000540749F|nr:hypothetical protein [Pseudomonas parafulva]AIZ32950.1 hypothetical protein NJ69_08040 [Pseudomonas parafulva]
MTLSAFLSDMLSERLTRKADNAALYTALTGTDGLREIGEELGYSAENGYRLIRVDRQLNSIGGEEFEIALVDDAQSSVAYYIKVTLALIPQPTNRNTAHNRVWRSASHRHSSALRDISQSVLFGYIAQQYDIVLTEGDVSGGGKFYWHRQMSRAIEGGFFVSVYDQIAQAFRPVLTQRALSDIQDKAWSTADHEPLIALVSTVPLSSQ